jgi:CBS domain-containing protein
VLQGLEACGLGRCPDGANATEPLFSRSVENWLEAARVWTAHPESESALLLASIVADNRAVSHLELGRMLTVSMLGHARSRHFLDGLLEFTLAVRPPRGIAHRGPIDLKRGGLWPVVLLGRWLGLVVGDTSGSTVDRIRRGAEAGLLTVGEAGDLAAAFEHLFQLRFDLEVDGFREQAADGQVVPGELDPLPRQYLHDSLKAVARIQGAARRAWGSGRATFVELS